tara:strand:+ start:3283 stop:4686 length:1404 start_codon:yes stop_codon:yes gene_type:complete
MKRLLGPIQEELLCLLCYDFETGAQAAAILEPRDFDPVYREIAEQALDYRSRHSQPPGEHTADLIAIAADADPERSDSFHRLLESMESTRDAFNPAFAIEQATTFVRFQRVREGVTKAVRALGKGTQEGLLDAEATLSGCLKAGAPTIHLGMEFADDLDLSTRFMLDPVESFPTGIAELDRYGLGPARRRLHMLLAPSGRGKSWWLLNLAVQARKHGKNVLYVSLEMGEDDIAQRLTQRMLGLPNRKVDAVRYQKFIETSDPADRGLMVKEVRVPVERALEDSDAEHYVRTELRKLQGQGRLLVTEFPTGTLTVDQLENFITVVAERKKMHPDLVIVDYADIMATPSGVPKWEAAIKVGEGLRAIAQKWNVGMATVSQVTSSGLKAKRVDVDHTADARGKIGTADTLLTYSQTDAERAKGVARLFVAKARMEQDRFTVLVAQSYETGHFVRSSVRMGSNYDLDGDDE